MNKKPDIHKAAGVIIRDRKLLLSRSTGKKIFIAPGGKIEPGETAKQALVRELHEEQGIIVREEKLAPMGVYQAIAAGFEAEQLSIEMEVFYVEDYVGEPTPQAEVAENIWYNTSIHGVKQGSIFEHEVIPELIKRNLID